MTPAADFLVNVFYLSHLGWVLLLGAGTANVAVSHMMYLLRPVI